MKLKDLLSSHVQVADYDARNPNCDVTVENDSNKTIYFFKRKPLFGLIM